MDVRRFDRGLVALVFAVLALASCTGDGEVADSEANTTLTATAIARATSVAAAPTVVATPRRPWQVGEPIVLEAAPYLDAELIEVDTDTVLPVRDELDREGGVFAWERSTDRLLFIEGMTRLFVAPEAVDGRPVGLASTVGDDADLLSLIVRLDPFEVVALPLSLNVAGDPDTRWRGTATVRVSTWRLERYAGRTLPEGDYTLDLQTLTLTLVEERRRGTSSALVVKRSWPGESDDGVALILQNGRLTLNQAAAGTGEEIVGLIQRWVLSPDGSKLLMLAERSQLVVYEFGEGGGRRWVLGRPAEYATFDWSPDGRYIAATTQGAFENRWQVLVFDVDDLDAVASPDVAAAPADGLLLPPFDDHWVWRWRSESELLLLFDGGVAVLDVVTGERQRILFDRLPYDTLAWDEATSTIAHSRTRGAPVSILELDGGEWFDITLLAASPHVGLFDMNWGAEGQWLALNTAPGRS